MKRRDAEHRAEEALQAGRRERAPRAPAAKAPPTQLDAVRDDIRASGLRATPARISVLDTVRRAAAPLSLADVSRRMPPHKHDRATIFRNLAALTRARLVRRVDPGDRTWRFVSDLDRSSWADFVCTACGTVQALERVTLQVEMPAVPRAIAKHQFELHVHGRCNRCL